MLYVSCIMALSMVVYPYSVRMMRIIRDLHERAHIYMRMYSARDLIRYELQQAPADMRYWRYVQDTQLCWQTPDGHWHELVWSNKQLWYKHGRYDSVQHKWMHAGRAIILDQLERCAMTYRYDTGGGTQLLKEVVIQGAIVQQGLHLPWHMTVLLRTGYRHE